MIRIVLGEGVHNVRCDLMPTRNGSAYVGNAMGREIVCEIVYERSRENMKADLARRRLPRLQAVAVRAWRVIRRSMWVE